MTKLLDDVLAEARKLSEQEQDLLAADMMESLTAIREHHKYQLSEDQYKELRRRIDDPNPHFLSAEEFRDLMQRLGT